MIIKSGDTIYWHYNAWYMIFAKIIRYITSGAAHVAKVLFVNDVGVLVAEARIIGGVRITFIPKEKLKSTSKKTINVLSAPRELTQNDVCIATAFLSQLDKERKSYGLTNMIREWNAIDSVFRFFGVKKNKEFFCSSLANQLNIVCGLYASGRDFHLNPKELEVVELASGFKKWKM
jgi:hypothetical protein